VSRYRRRSLVLGGVAAALLLLAVLGNGGGASGPPAPPMQQVIELRRPVQAGQRIGASDLGIAEVPATWADPHQVGDPAAAVGRRAAVTMPAGSPLMDAELEVAPQLPAHRDVTLRLDDAAGLPLDAPDGAAADLYLVEPGTHPRVRLVLRGVYVVASNREDGAATATVRVSPEQVALVISAEAHGSLRLVTRGAA
jgi:Flp pilus assembly protein CpaB